MSPTGVRRNSRVAINGMPTGAAPTPTGLDPLELAVRTDPIRIFALRFGLALFFVRLSMLHQIVGYLLHFNPYILYILGPPAIIGVFVCGAIPRTFQSRAGMFWTGYALWMALAAPFSSWRAGSLMTVFTYYRAEIVLLFILGGLIVTWHEFRMVCWAAAAAAVISLVTSRLFASPDGAGRLALDIGSVGNSNDFAAHLLYVLPFLLWVVLDSKSVVLRLCAVGGVMAGSYVIMTTASRGATLALLLSGATYFWRTTAAQRILMLLALPVMLVVAVAVLPQGTLTRIRTLTGESATAGADRSAEALMSSEAREYTLRKSIEYTLQFPIFGVGPGQFPSYEGNHTSYFGGHGYWHSTHNVVTQASSESGIPAALFMVAGFISSVFGVGRVYRQAAARPDCRDIAVAAICVNVALLGFSLAIFFLNFAYMFYSPALAGLIIGMERAASSEFKLRIQPPAAPPPWQAATVRR